MESIIKFYKVLSVKNTIRTHISRYELLKEQRHVLSGLWMATVRLRTGSEDRGHHGTRGSHQLALTRSAAYLRTILIPQSFKICSNRGLI